MSVCENTTDSVPSPPRDEGYVYVPEDNKKEKTTNGTEKGEEPENKSQNNKPVPPQANGSVPRSAPSLSVHNVQISHSPNFHYGPTNEISITIGAPPSNKKEKVRETEEMAALKNSQKPVLDKDIDCVKENIGHGYDQTFLLLGFTKGRIEQNEAAFRNDVNGMIRHMLVDWRQKHGKTGATVRMLANALWDSNQRDALKEWSLKYDQLHK